MQQLNMTDYYRDFDDNDQLQENDDDIGALGSILSWDEDDQGEDAVNGVAASMSSALRERENSSGMSAPPDTVQFSINDGIPQFNFLSSQGLNGSTPTPPQELQRDNNNNSKLTLQLPLPTPIANFGRRDDETKASEMGQGSMQTNTQQQQQMMAKSQDQQGLAANFAQLLAQQAGNLIQAQQQRQQQQQAQLQQQQQQQVKQPQQPPMAYVLPNMQAQSQSNQQSMPQQQQQQQQPVQLSITSDPSTFLQQLQYAQLQQQFQAAQAQQQQQQQQLAAKSTASQVANALQRLPIQLPRSNVPIAAGPSALGTRSRSPSTSRQRTMQPPTKRARTASNKKAAPPPSSQSKIFSQSEPLASVVVSASDTDYEAIKRTTEAMANSTTDSDHESHDEKNITVEEKAQVNRDRNREHARNTRLRKKAYLEKLKSTVDELCRERDTLVSERTGAANLLVEMHNTRIEVLMSFFALRSTNEKRRKLWSSILDESCFVCVMPVTPYRSFPASEVQVSKCQRTILGIDAMMADTASLHVLFESLVDRPKFPDAKIEFRYTLVTEEAVVAGNQMMARWVMSTTNATQCGARMEVSKQGMLCCKFNSAHKIIGMELMFDVMAFMLQLKQAAGSDGFSVIPNTVQTCQRAFDKPMVMTLAEPPYTIVQVNKLWEDLTGYTSEEVVGKTSCSILQRDESKLKGLREMMTEVRFKRSASAVLVNFKKSGERFRHFLLVFPLSTDSRITHYLALTTHADDGAVDYKEPAPAPQVSLRQNQAILLPSPQDSISSFPARATSAPTPSVAVPPVMPPMLFNAGLPSVGVATGAHGQITLPPQVLGAAALGQMPPPSTQLRAPFRTNIPEAKKDT